MIQRYKNDVSFRHIVWITVVYILCQGLLITMSGRWWDDWVYADKNWNYLHEVMLQSSLPSEAYLDAVLWLLPDGFYRVIVFFLYFISTLFLYKCLLFIPLFSEKDSFWIAVLFSTIPVDDARVTWICFPYALGLMLYMIATFLAIKSYYAEGKAKVKLRVLSYVLYLLSYPCIESIMLMNVLIVIAFCFMDLEKREGRNFFKTFFGSVLKNCDYLILPVIWYFGDKILFPAYGSYGGHGYVTWDTLPISVVKSPYYAMTSLSNIAKNYIGACSNTTAVLILTLVLIIYIILRILKKIKTEEMVEKNLKYVLILFTGIISFMLGMLPYSLKRNGGLETIHIGGRDAILLAFGTACIIYSLAKLIFRAEMSRVVMVVLIALGIIHFNFTYLEWQECYYQQLQLQDEIKNNEDILNNNTFLVIYNNDKICSNFYQTNGNSWAATGEETRFYIIGTGNIQLLLDMNADSQFLKAYGMKDYDYSDKEIDGILYVDYSDISRKDLIKWRWKEIFNKSEFESWISNIKDIKYVKLEKEESDNIISMYEKGELTDKLLLEMYCD